MKVNRIGRGLAMSLVLAAGCTPDVEKQPAVTTSAATIARFAPNSEDTCLSVLPFPSDLAKDATTGRLNIPFCKTDSTDAISLKTGLRTLDGYSQGVAMTAPFSGPIDVASAAAAVKVFDSEGQPVAVGTQFKSSGDTHTLYIVPAAPLKEASKYMVVITTDLLDAAGKNIVSDQVFTFAKSVEPLIDEHKYSRFSPLDDASANALEALRQGLAPMFEKLTLLGVPREKVAVAWAFTTQTGHRAMAGLAAAVTAQPAAVMHTSYMPAAMHPLMKAAGIPTSHLCDVHAGTVTLKSLLTDSGTFGVDIAGNPLVSTVGVDYVLTVPNADPTGAAAGCVRASAAAPAAWSMGKIAVFTHGLGRCKNDALALANDLAKQGFATLAFDGPRAGGRMVGSLGDQDVDGCPDQPETPEFIMLPGGSTNPFAIRDHLREWGLEVAQMLATAKATPHLFAGMTAGTATPKMALLGHSWGGMAAALGGSVSNAVDVVVINAASGELGAVFEPAIRDTVKAQLEAAGINPTSAEGLATLEATTASNTAAFRWVMEPGDPLYAAMAYPEASRLPVLVQVVSAGTSMTDAKLHSRDTQTKLAGTFNRAPLDKVTFTADFGTAKEALCDSDKGVVGALLKPCRATATDTSTDPKDLTARALTGGLRRQAITFIASSLAGSPVVCNPDFMAACQ